MSLSMSLTLTLASCLISQAQQELEGLLTPLGLNCTHLNTHMCMHVLTACQVRWPRPQFSWGKIRTGTKRALKPDIAQSRPLLRPCRLPLFTRRLNEAAGAAEMNQSPAWAWEGRRTGRPGQAGGLGGDQQDGASQWGWGSDASRRKPSSCPATAGAAPTSFSLRPPEVFLLGKPSWDRAGRCTEHPGT